MPLLIRTDKRYKIFIEPAETLSERSPVDPSRNPLQRGKVYLHLFLSCKIVILYTIINTAFLISTDDN